MQCDVCGQEGQLLKVKIEGTDMNVCRNCSSHGNVLGVVREPVVDVRPKIRFEQKEEEPEKIRAVVSDFSSILRKKRESLGLNQKEFAMKIMEKESVVHKLENGSFEPSLKLAEKLERSLNVKIIEEYAESFESENESESEEVTIGDMIKIRKRPK